MILDTVKKRWSTIISRGVLLIIIWFILTDGDSLSWWIGLPVVLLALSASLALLPPQPFIWLGFLSFVPFFLYRSLLGGVDVAWRAFHPSMPIFPDLIRYSTRLPYGLPQVFMANTISLLPGTLSAVLERGVIEVHVLDRRNDYLAEVRMVECRVAKIFGATLKPSNENKCNARVE